MKRMSIACLAMVLALALPRAGVAADPPGTFMMGDTKARFYGFAEMNVTYDLSGRQDPLAFDWAGAPAGIPIDNPGAPNQRPSLFSTNASSRAGITTTTPSAVGEIGTKLEADFNGNAGGYSGFTNSTFFRIRQAYGTVGKWVLLGQTWSTFVDLASYPDTVDWNPTGNNPLVRQPMIRFTLPMGAGGFSVAAEQSAETISGLPAAVAALPRFQSYPDVAANLTFPFSMGHVSLRGVALNYRATNLDKWGFAGAVSGSLKFGGDTLVWAVQGGPGVGRYMWNTGLSGQGAVYQPAGVTPGAVEDVRLWTAVGYHAGYTHVWSKAFRSNLVWSQSFTKDDADIRAVRGASYAGDNRRIEQGMVNTFWSFAPNASLGIEYEYARRYTFGGLKGTQNRINGVFHFNFF